MGIASDFTKRYNFIVNSLPSYLYSFVPQSCVVYVLSMYVLFCVNLICCAIAFGSFTYTETDCLLQFKCLDL